MSKSGLSASKNKHGASGKKLTMSEKKGDDEDRVKTSPREASPFNATDITTSPTSKPHFGTIPVASGNVKVVVRVRPLNQKEKKHSDDVCTEFNPNKTGITVTTPPEKSERAAQTEPHKFNFDYVFDCDSEQSEVFEVAAKPIVDSLFEGFNGTILAYGQTSSGKTHTMQGELSDERLQGLIPRMVTNIFERIETMSASIEFTVKVSMMEIYMERIKDLLDPTKSNLKIHEDKTKGIYVEDATETYVTERDEVYEIMKLGNDNRAIGVTDMNKQSSRSHSVFLLTVTQNDLENYTCKTGKLFLVDLAGSEKVGKTGASGQTLEEAKQINRSLTMLGMVINALTDGKSSHIPYRDSKLTRILQESLGGNSKTCLIITCSPSVYNAAETLSTCKFGMRAKSIKNTAKINKQLTVAELKLIVKRLEDENITLTKRIILLEKIIVNMGGTIPTEGEMLIQMTTEDEKEVKSTHSSEHEETEEARLTFERQKEILDEIKIEEKSEKKKTQKRKTKKKQSRIILEEEQKKTEEEPSTENAKAKPKKKKKTKPTPQQVNAGIDIQADMNSEAEEEEDEEDEDEDEEDKNQLKPHETNLMKEKMLKKELMQQSASQKDDIVNLLNQLKREREKVKLKENKLEILRKQFKTQEAKLGNLEKVNSTLLKTVAENKVKVKKLEEEKEDKEKKTLILQELKDNLEQELQEIKDEQIRFSEELAETKRNNIHGKKQNEQYCLELSSLKEQLLKKDEFLLGIYSNPKVSLEIKDELKEEGVLPASIISSKEEIINAQKEQGNELINEFKKTIESKDSQISKLEKKIQQLEKKVELSMSSQHMKIVEMSKRITDEATKKERSRYNQEKSILIKDLQNRVEKVIQLEMELYEAKQQNSNLESSMTEGEKALKKKVTSLEKNLEQLTHMYHQLISQRATLNVEKKLSEKKIERKNDKIRKLEKELNEVKEQSLVFRIQIDHLKNEMSKYTDNVEDLINPQLKDVLNVRIPTTNRVKAIRGGANKAKVKNSPVVVRTRAMHMSMDSNSHVLGQLVERIEENGNLKKEKEMPLIQEEAEEK